MKPVSVPRNTLDPSVSKCLFSIFNYYRTDIPKAMTKNVPQIH